MTEFETSADGTRIAYDRAGSGPALLLVGGATQFRGFDPTTVDLAGRLAEAGFTVVNYDRRGRGESSDTAPYDVDREVEDIAALVDAVGGSATLYGSSSGAVLCIWAAQAIDGVTRLILWEPPLDLESDGAESLDGLQERLRAGDREGAVAFFMSGMPPEWFEGMKSSPAWPVMLAIAPTLAYDAAVLERAERSRDWSSLLADVTVPVTVLLGEETLPIFPPAADALVAALPNATQRRIAARDHGWTPDVMTRAILDTLND